MVTEKQTEQKTESEQKEKAKSQPDYTEQDRTAAWKFYIEVALQPLSLQEHGNAQLVVNAYRNLFHTAAHIFGEAGRESILTAKMVVGFLNKEVRPFTLAWQKRIDAGDFNDHLAGPTSHQFEEELAELVKATSKLRRVLAKVGQIDKEL